MRQTLNATDSTNNTLSPQLQQQQPNADLRFLFDTGLLVTTADNNGSSDNVKSVSSLQTQQSRALLNIAASAMEDSYPFLKETVRLWSHRFVPLYSTPLHSFCIHLTDNRVVCLASCAVLQAQDPS